MGEQIAEKNMARLDELLATYEGKKGTLIPVLQKAQDIFGYLPKEVLIHISRKMKIPISQVYGVVTFYAQFHLEPRGRHILRSCQGTACHVRGAGPVLKEARAALGLVNDKDVTTSDLKFTVETVACIGCCGLAPVIMIDDKTYGKLTSEKVSQIVKSYYK